ncbi:CDYL2 [Branchiostoma lanceolatum]|uniref:CDYL2 protein n=1 Tax=Branchiostoma lanceolatum TaxID=7740 RepID=A0A8K0EY41_BRALA|nr:CDYL2 [Branchiostoma lanceolatum]
MRSRVVATFDIQIFVTSPFLRPTKPAKMAPPEEFEVEKLQARREMKGRVEFLVRWKGYGSEEDSWEPISNLEGCVDMIHAFYENRRRFLLKKQQQIENKIIERVTSSNPNQPSRSRSRILSEMLPGNAVPNGSGPNGPTTTRSLERGASPPRISEIKQEPGSQPISPRQSPLARQQKSQSPRRSVSPKRQRSISLHKEEIEEPHAPSSARTASPKRKRKSPSPGRRAKRRHREGPSGQEKDIEVSSTTTSISDASEASSSFSVGAENEHMTPKVLPTPPRRPSLLMGPTSPHRQRSLSFSAQKSSSDPTSPTRRMPYQPGSPLRMLPADTCLFSQSKPSDPPMSEGLSVTCPDSVKQLTTQQLSPVVRIKPVSAEEISQKSEAPISRRTRSRASESVDVNGDTESDDTESHSSASVVEVGTVVKRRSPRKSVTKTVEYQTKASESDSDDSEVSTRRPLPRKVKRPGSKYKHIALRSEEGYTHIKLLHSCRGKPMFKPQGMKELTNALNEIEDDDDSKLLLLSGSGSVFCAGIDITYLATQGFQRRRRAAAELAEPLRELVEALIEFSKPIVAAVNGLAFGFGAALLGLCDIVYASDKAVFQMPYMQIGQTPEGCSSYTFPLVLGTALSSDVLLAGRRLTASEAYSKGLVSQVFWPTSLMGEVIPRVLKMSTCSAKALAMSKALLRQQHKAKLLATNEAECDMLRERWEDKECYRKLKAYVDREGLAS